MNNTDCTSANVMSKVIRWIALGRTGISSETIAVYLTTGTHHKYGHNHPHDPADLNRCLLLLDAVPELRQDLYKMADVSDIWAKLIKRWDEVEKCFIDEVGLDWSKGGEANKTYDLMIEIGC